MKKVLYIPCLISIWRQMHNNHCYRIMFYIGVVDMLAVVLNGWLTGIFGFMGVVFCSYPRLNYVFGAYGLCGIGPKLYEKNISEFQASGVPKPRSKLCWP